MIITEKLYVEILGILKLTHTRLITIDKITNKNISLIKKEEIVNNHTNVMKGAFNVMKRAFEMKVCRHQLKKNVRMLVQERRIQAQGPLHLIKTIFLSSFCH